VPALGDINVSKEDDLMSQHLENMGADRRIVARTKYFDEIIRLEKLGLSDDEIDEILLTKFASEKGKGSTVKGWSKRLFGVTPWGVATGWGIWISTIYGLHIFEVMNFYENEWLEWSVFRPVIFLAVTMWVRIYILRK